MTLGIDEMPMIRIAKGIQNHTTPTAAPVISRRRRHHANGAVGAAGLLAGAAGAGDIWSHVGYCDHAINLWTYGRRRHSVFRRDWRGKTPALC